MLDRRSLLKASTGLLSLPFTRFLGREPNDAQGELKADDALPRVDIYREKWDGDRVVPDLDNAISFHVNTKDGNALVPLGQCQIERTWQYGSSIRLVYKVKNPTGGSALLHIQSNPSSSTDAHTEFHVGETADANLPSVTGLRIWLFRARIPALHHNLLGVHYKTSQGGQCKFSVKLDSDVLDYGETRNDDWNLTINPGIGGGGIKKSS